MRNNSFIRVIVFVLIVMGACSLVTRRLNGFAKELGLSFELTAAFEKIKSLSNMLFIIKTFLNEKCHLVGCK